MSSSRIITESSPGSAKSSPCITAPNAPPGGTPGITGQGQINAVIIMILFDLGNSVPIFGRPDKKDQRAWGHGLPTPALKHAFAAFFVLNIC